MTIPHNIANPPESRRAAVAATAGFAALYAVAIVFFYCDWLFAIPHADVLNYGALLNGTLCLAAATVFALSRRRKLSEPVVIGLGTISYAAALVAVAYATASGSLVFAYGAGAAAGIGAGLLMPLWFDRAGRLSGNRFAYAVGAASLVSAPLALALDLLPEAAMVAVCLTLVLASSALLVRSMRGGWVGGPNEATSSSANEVLENPNDATSSLKQLAAPFVYVFLLSLTYGMLDVVAMASPAVPAPATGFASQIAGLAAICAFLLYVRFGAGRYATLLNVALALIATGLLFLPFLPSAYSVALVVLTHLGWEISLLVLYALVIEVFRHDRANLVAFAALAFAFPRPGMVAGWFVASFVASDSQFTFAQMTAIAFALLYLIMMGAWLLRTREKRAAERSLRKRDELIKRYVRAREDLQELACDDLAKAHSLTKRETELLKLFAQGRDAAYAEKLLYLSHNTVKSYAKSLYAKLGVHSKQEVIDLVRASLPLDNDR
ncbi:helix-turn-helix transcriptional regulator [Eggerthella guodeyinii]|uniref:HTH luxR-type domain-containing protein n=1 Tax=Eggerthella guodeyinii TaxID=2690837 RepID=A0A6N7RL09_9ACTN|nr:LuxR C-terminal-related transcriptional regulator [Eggerthella guodeyinii]MRX81550.1 hypothetical protein [Eggerthella guodeyinii]